MKAEEEKEKIMDEARERNHNKDHSLVILNLAILNQAIHEPIHVHAVIIITYFIVKLYGCIDRLLYYVEN